LDLDEAVAFARLAAPAFDVKREAPGLVAPHLRLFCPGKDRPDLVEDLGVGRRVRAWRTADRALVDHDHLVDLGIEGDLLMGPGLLPGAVQLLHHALVERVVDECGLARAGDAGYDREEADRDL